MLFIDLALPIFLLSSLTVTRGMKYVVVDLDDYQLTKAMMEKDFEAAAVRLVFSLTHQHHHRRLFAFDLVD